MTCTQSKRLAGKVAIVTGGNSGIGLAAARAFASEGAQVMIAARRQDEGEAAVASIMAAGGEAAFIDTDVADSASVRRMVQVTVERFGRLDIAFNNAGFPGQVDALITDADEHRFDQVMGVNVRGVWLCMKYQIREMLKAGAGSIINCSSITGLRGGQRSSAYYTSKHAVVGMTKAVAAEFGAQNVRVNAICPGMVMTDMLSGALAAAPEKFEMLKSRISMGRLAQPDEVADAVVWLASNESRYVTGVALPVDGGMSI